MVSRGGHPDGRHAILRKPPRPGGSRAAPAADDGPGDDEFARSGTKRTIRSGEDDDSPVPGIVHRYPDRVLFLVTGFCSTYCRYCTRSRMVGRHQEIHADRQQMGKGDRVHREHPEVRDVLLSGGDPLTLADETAGMAARAAAGIPHVETHPHRHKGAGRPAAADHPRPGATMLKRYHPLWMSIHFTHPDELTPEVAQACTRLADAGIPLGSQTVLLSGVNDDVETMKTARPRPAARSGSSPTTSTSATRSPAPPISGPRSRRGWRSSGACGDSPPATPCRPTSSTPRAAAGRSRSCPNTWWDRRTAIFSCATTREMSSGIRTAPRT